MTRGTRRVIGAGTVVVLALVASGRTGRAAQDAATAQDGVRGDEPQRSEYFGRMFHLPPFAPATPAVTAALARMGARERVLDARDHLAAGPVALIVDPLLSVNNPNNDLQTAGMTFLGQFIDHDMTFDTTSRLGRPTNPRRAPNARRPYFDLDSVYGDGPSGSPQLFEASDRAKLHLESSGLHEDLPRDPSGRAIIADPRNDENVIIAGLHAALLLAHNRAVDLVRAEQPELGVEDAFHEARRRLTCHYQWIVLHEFLPQLVGQPIVDAVLAEGPRFYRPRQDDAFIPVEFQMAYRVGHSMVRPSYRANFSGNGGQPFFAFVFDPAQNEAGDPDDLRGGVRSQRRFVGWTTFFRFPGFEDDVRPPKRLDTRLSTPLFDLPLGAIASGAPPASLAERNLLRHLTWSLPSGQAIAAAMAAPTLSDAHFADLAAFHPRFVGSTPLWYYVLKEAEVVEHGARLGPVGARLVAEVFVGLLQSDSASILNADEPFVPTLGATPGQFTTAELLTFAGVGGRR
jgi:hypothetical protein